MPARLYDVFLILGEQQAARGANDNSRPDFNFYENNTYQLRLNPLQRVQPGAVTLQRFTASTFSEFAGFEACLGTLDAKPDGGDYKLKLDATSELTDAIAFDADADAVKDALEALSGIGVGKLDVTLGNESNIYIIRPVDPDDDYTFAFAEVALTPLCEVRLRKASDGEGTYTMLKVRQMPLAFTDGFAFLTPPPSTLTSLRTGNSTRNAIMLLTIPAEAVGSLSLDHGGFFTGTFKPFAITEVGLAAALNGLYADSATVTRFVVSREDAFHYEIECVGPLARQAVTICGITLYGQVASDSPVAEFPVNALPLELRVSGEDSVQLLFEVAGYDDAGNEHTLVRSRATVFSTMLSGGLTAVLSTVGIRYETVFVSADAEGSAEIIGQRSQNLALPGSGTVPSAGTYQVTFTHGLGTLTPLVTGWMLTDTAGDGSWREMDGTEFEARCLGDANAVRITMAHIPPTAGHVGCVQFTVTNLDAQALANAHRHTTDAIDGVSPDTGLTLTQIIAALRVSIAALTGDLPGIPGSLLVDGSIEPSKINLSSLISNLFSTGGANVANVLTNLRVLVTDATLVSNVFSALATNTALSTVLQNFAQTVLSQVNNTPQFAAAIKTTIAGDAGLSSFFQALVVAALQDGATVRDAVIFSVPDLAFTMPDAATANGFLPDGTQDGFFPLPCALFTLTEDADVTGRLSKPVAALKGHYSEVVTKAHTRGFVRLFSDGQIVYCTGGTLASPGEWFPGVLDTGKMFTTDGDVTLFTLGINDRMLSADTRFSLLAAVTLQQRGNCEGRWLLELKRGTLAAEASGTPGNISDITWNDTIISQQLVLDATDVTHNFGFAVNRTARTLCVTNSTTTVTCPSTALLAVGMGVAGTGIPSGALIASITNGTTFVLSAAATTSTTQTLSLFASTKTLYVVTEAAAAPTSANFVLGAFLSRYDTQNVDAPRGIVTATMKGVRASIVKL